MKNTAGTFPEHNRNKRFFCNFATQVFFTLKGTHKQSYG
jgi:hypothetical protein